MFFPQYFWESFPRLPVPGRTCFTDRTYSLFTGITTDVTWSFSSNNWLYSNSIQSLCQSKQKFRGQSYYPKVSRAKQKFRGQQNNQLTITAFVLHGVWLPLTQKLFCINPNFSQNIPEAQYNAFVVWSSYHICYHLINVFVSHPECAENTRLFCLLPWSLGR